MMPLELGKISDTVKFVIFLVLLVAEGAYLVSSVESNTEAIKRLEARMDKKFGRVSETTNDHENRIRKDHDEIIYIKGKEGY